MCGAAAVPAACVPASCTAVSPGRDVTAPAVALAGCRAARTIRVSGGGAARARFAVFTAHSRYTPTPAVNAHRISAAMSTADRITLATMGFAQAETADREMMDLARGRARATLAAGGSPVGAVLGARGRLSASADKGPVLRSDPFAHC